MRGREGRREGGEREGERELCDLVIRESILGEQEIEAANEKRKEKKGKQQESKRRRPYLIPKRSFFASPCADMISTCKHICVQKDEKQSTSVL